MKKEVSKPLMIGAIVLVVLIAAFAVTKFASGPPEFERPKVQGGIPVYLKDKMTPEQIKALEETGVNVNETAGSPTGQPSQAPK